MNMFASAGGVVELWVTKTDHYTSKTTGEIYATVQSIAPIPDGARGNAKGFEISEYTIEPTLLDGIVFKGEPLLCKFASVVRPTKDRFGNITNTQVLVELLSVGNEIYAEAHPRRQPAPQQSPARSGQQPASDKPSEPAKS